MRLRPMTRGDLPLLARWLRDPLVAEWWHDDPEEVAQQYGPALDGDDPTVLRIGEADGRPVGFVQWYRLTDEPAYLAELRRILPVPDDAWSLDHLIGEPAARGSGLGTAQIVAALAELGPAPVVVPVQAGNAASIAALRRAGFRVAAHGELEPDNPAHGRAHTILNRPAPVARRPAAQPPTREPPTRGGGRRPSWPSTTSTGGPRS